MFTIYTQSESLLLGKSNGYIFIQNGPLLQELWAGWIRMTLLQFKLRCYPFRNASFAPVLRSVSVQRSTRPLFTCIFFPRDACPVTFRSVCANQNLHAQKI